MKLYSSLFHRKMKIAYKNFWLRLLMAMYFMGSLLTQREKYRGESIDSIFVYFLIGAIAGGLSYGVRNTDKNCGWRSYSYVLPITGQKYALFDYALLVANILLFGLITLLCTSILPVSPEFPVLDCLLVYLMIAGIVALVNILYEDVVKDPRAHTVFKVILVVAILCMIAFIPFDYGSGPFRFRFLLQNCPWAIFLVFIGTMVLNYWIIFRYYDERQA